MRLWGLFSFTVPLVVYISSLSPYPAAWDTAEFQTVPYILGIAHPTGFPVFILLGWIFTHVVAIGTVAWRMGLLSALCMSATALVCYHLCRRIAVPPAGACFAAWLFAAGEVAWTRGTRAEVHSLAALFVCLAVLCALCWYQETRARWLMLCALAVGLGLGTHPTIVLALPGLAILVTAAQHAPAPRVVAACVALLIVPSLTYAYIPLRSRQVTAERIDPTLSLGIAPGRPYWDYGNPSTPQAFVRYVSGSDFRASASLVSLLDPLLYARIAPRVWQDLSDEFPLVALALAVVGAGGLLMRASLEVTGLGLALLPSMPFAYGYEAEADAARYALPAFVFITVLVAYGVTFLAALLAQGERRAQRVTVALGLLLLASSEFWVHRDTFGQRFDRRFGDYVDRVRNGTPRDAVIVADWTYATPLAYAAFVEQSLGDRIIETAHPEDDGKRLNAWAAHRPVYVVGPTDMLIPGVKLALTSAGDPEVFEVQR